MITVFSIIALFILMWIMAYFRLPAKVWSSILVVVVILMCWTSLIASEYVIPICIILIPPIILLNIAPLRCRWVTKSLLSFYERSLPHISQTEKAAINAGDTAWEKEIFCGDPNWKQLLSEKKPQLSEDEISFIDNQVETLCQMLNDWDITHNRIDMPETVWQYLKDEKFFGMIIPKEYSGLGFSALAHSTIISKIASRSYSVAVNVMVPNSLGPAEFLIHYGTDEQKQKYLPELAVGNEIPCFALTSEKSGSDATSITDTGEVCVRDVNGKSEIGLHLNWKKRYITLAPVATLLGIAVDVKDPHHLIGKQVDIGISFVLVPANTPGVSIGSRHFPLHQAFMNGPTTGENVFIPIDNIIGGPDSLGKGWEMMTASLAVGRGISLPAVSSGMSKLCARMTGAYARLREQFNQPIGRFEGVAECLARIGGYTYLCEATRLFTAVIIDSGHKPAIASAISKYHLTEMARKVVNDAMDVHAGKGIIMGERNYLANIYTAVPINITVEGANILTRNLIIFGQGALRCHPYLTEELSALNDESPTSKLVRFDHLIFEHMGYFLHNAAKVSAYGLSCGQLIRVPKNGKIARYLRQLTRMSCAFAMLSDVTFLLMRQEIKKKEMISARLGDILSYLYMGSAVVKYYNDLGQPKEDEAFFCWSIQHCLYQCQLAIEAICLNLPQRWIGSLLWRFIFGWGRAYRPPKDSLAVQMAEQMMQDSAFRDRLTSYIYIGEENKDATAQMDGTLKYADKIADAYVKLNQALSSHEIDRNLSFKNQCHIAFQIGILSQEEADQLKEFHQLQMEVIAVDVMESTQRKEKADG